MKIRFVSKSSSKSRNRWSFVYWKKFGYTKNYGESALEIVWPKFLGYLLVFSILGYLTTGAAALQWVHRKAPGNEITYLDVINPMRWPEVGPKVGKAHISLGLQSIDDGDYSSGLLYLRRGLVRYPQDHGARFVVAKFYAESGYRDIAISLLKESLQYGLPEYAIEIVKGALAIADFEQVESSAKELLNISEFYIDSSNRIFTTRALLISLLEQRKFEEVLEVSRGFNAEGDTPVQFVDAEMMALLSLGQESEAMQIYDNLPAAARGDLNLGILSIQAAMLNGDQADTLNRIESLIPWDDQRYWPFHAQTILILHAIGEDAEVSKRVAQYLEQNKENAYTLGYLSGRLFDAGNLGLLQTVQKGVSIDNPASVTIDFHLVQTLLSKGADQEAQVLYESWKNRLPKDFTADGYIEWMDLLTEFSDTSDGRIADSIIAWVSREAHPHDLYLLTAEVFASRRNFDAAERILTEGTRYYTFNGPLNRMHAKIVKERRDLQEKTYAQSSSVAEDRLSRQSSAEVVQQIQLQRLRESSGAADELARARLQNSPSEVDPEIARKRLENNPDARERVSQLARERLEYLRNQD